MREINAGFMALPARRLAGWLGKLSNRNAQKEYYLTDVVSAAVAEGLPVRPVQVQDAWEAAGVNSKAELAELERQYQKIQAARLLDAAVTLADPARIDVRGELTCGLDVSIDVNCVFEGKVALADGVRVGPNCVLRNVSVGPGSETRPHQRPDRRAHPAVDQLHQVLHPLLLPQDRRRQPLACGAVGRRPRHAVRPHPGPGP